MSFPQEVLERTRSCARVLDAGGSFIPLPTATHIIDIVPPQAQTKAEFVNHDICRKPWPFADKFFDFSYCSNTLEDIRDPIGACEELMRVSRAGFIATPSRLRETFHQKRGYFWRRLAGRPLRVGFGHHRWFCEWDGATLSFLAKTSTFFYSPAHFITREEAGRDLTEAEANLTFFWQDKFAAAERVLVGVGEIEADFIRFKAEASRKLRGN
jgi:methyltransferase family protein